MKVISLVVRVFSLIFHLLLSLAMVGLFLVGYFSSGAGLNLGMAPWEGSSLVWALLGLGLGGLLCVVLAVTGTLRFLYMIWTIVIAYLLVSSYFLSNYRFAGEGEFRFAIYFVIAALIAVVGGIWLLKSPLRRKKAA